MSMLLHQLWKDDAGALISMEFLFVATILVIGVIIGLANVRDAVNTELSELANAILALSQGYVLSGQSGCNASVDGSEADDTPSTVANVVKTAPASPSNIDQLPCD